MRYRDELKWIAPLVVVCGLIFANSLSGAFVYDDLRQILRNLLIQDNSQIWKALTSDVWAFKGDGTIAASNYWRPTFTAWHILNFRLFGATPLGWHVSNVLLHSGVCVMAFALLRRWAFSAIAAFTIVLIFAVHPVHVESVAWISGSPDLLFALAFLASLWFAQSYAESGKPKALLLALLLYALALGAKEIGFLCLPIYYFVMAGVQPAPKKRIDARSTVLMFAGAAAGYFLIRWTILGVMSAQPDGAVTVWSALLSFPEMFAFYLGQIFFPYRMAASYPLETVTVVGPSNFFLPLLVSVAGAAGVCYLARKAPRGRLAAALFILPLATAFGTALFRSEHLVQDRYLYLPLFGMLMLIVPFAVRFIGERGVLIAGVAISLVLATLTFSYNRAWADELALWEWTTRVDDSAFAAMQYGSELSEKGRFDDAVAAFSRSIAKGPSARGYLGRGRALSGQGNYPEAEKDLKTALQFPAERLEAYALYQTYEALGMVYEKEGNLDAAVKTFSDARVRLPIYSAALTCDLAIVLYQKGLKSDALRELEGARTQARRELLPESSEVFLRLGMLYAEAGRKEEARAALNEFMNRSRLVSDKAMVEEREQAGKLLSDLK
jgi:protein O-mannosyl-transferase